MGVDDGGEKPYKPFLNCFISGLDNRNDPYNLILVVIYSNVFDVSHATQQKPRALSAPQQT